MTTQAATQTRPDTQEMVIVHRVFRREFRLLPQLVTATAPGDGARAEVVARHADELTTALHHHHAGEDALLWPVLRERDHAHLAQVERMESQHVEMTRLLAEVERLVPLWRTSPDLETREQLAAAFERLSTALDAHLAEEEREVLPLAAEHMTLAEWEALGERGMASIPKNRLLVFLGYILEEASPAERTMFLSKVPLPGRIAYRLIGVRQHKREAQLLRAAIPQQRVAGPHH